MPGTSLKIDARDGFTVVALYGDLDVSTIEETVRALSACAVAGARIVVDLGGLTFIDCASLHGIMAVQDQARRAGGELALANPPPLVLRVLRLAGLIGRCSLVTRGLAAYRHPQASTCVTE